MKNNRLINSSLAILQNFEKRLLASSCLSVRPSAWNKSAPTGEIFMNFGV